MIRKWKEHAKITQIVMSQAQHPKLPVHSSAGTDNYYNIHLVLKMHHNIHKKNQFQCTTLSFLDRYLL